MKIEQVGGEDRGDIVLYALSTCGWCKRTKALLNELGVQYRYVDVDQLPAGDQEKVQQTVARWNPAQSFPTMVINDQQCIVGYQPQAIREALGL